MNQNELQRILLMPEGLRAQYLAALKKPQKMSDGGGFGRKAQRINQATSFGDEPMGNQIVKDVGGNWLGGNVEQALKPLEFLEAARYQHINDAGFGVGEGYGRPMTPEELTAQNVRLNFEPNKALNKWVRGNLTNYVKKQMGTEADPVRKLAEQGISHFPIAEDPRYWEHHGESSRNALSGRQVSKSDLAKQWENRSDAMIHGDTAKGHQNMMGRWGNRYSDKDAWIKNAAPDTKIYEISGNRPEADLGFDHIMDVLNEDLAAGRIRPEQLSKISMEQAVRRVYEYDQDKLKKMRDVAIKNTEGMPVHKVYDDGHKWIELAAPQGEAALSDLSRKILAKHKAEGTQLSPGVLEAAIKQNGEDKLREALKYEGETMGHCVGGYCPDVISGASRIFSLRDAKGEPHVTIEVKPSHKYSSDETDKLSNWFTLQPEALQDEITQEATAAHEAAKQANTSKENRYYWGMAMNDAIRNRVGEIPPNIVQIKGKGNRAPNPKYLPYVQDFVKSGQWGDEIGDFHNTGLKTLDQAFPKYEDAKRYGKTNPDTRYVTQADIDAYHKQVNEELLNEYSKYRLKPDPESKNTLGRNDLMTIRELAELEFPGDLQKQANMIRGAMQGNTEPGAYSGSIFPPLEEKKGRAMKAGGSIKPVGYTKEKVTVSPSLDRMQYELMSVKHFKKAK